MLVKTFIGLTLASSAFANVYITEPVETTSFAPGQQATIQWQDDGNPPSLEEFGLAKVSIYTGNANEQTLLQSIVQDVDVSQLSSVTFTPDPSIGPNSDQYFIRVESQSAQDPNNPSNPALAFSSRFSLTGMTGQFSDIASSQIEAQSTAPLPSSDSSLVSLSSPTSASETAQATSTGTARITTSISAKSAAATSTSPSSASRVSSKSGSSSFASSSSLSPSTVSSAPTELASAITTRPNSGAMIGAQMYTGFLLTLFAGLVGILVL